MTINSSHFSKADEPAKIEDDTINIQRLGMTGNLVKGSITVMILGVIIAATNPKQAHTPNTQAIA